MTFKDNRGCHAQLFNSEVPLSARDVIAACLAIKCVLRRVVENATTWPTSNLPSGNVTWWWKMAHLKMNGLFIDYLHIEPIEDGDFDIF